MQLLCRVFSFPQLPPWPGRIPSRRKDETGGGRQTQTMCTLSPCQARSCWIDRVLGQAWRAWGLALRGVGFPWCLPGVVSLP